MDISRYIVEYIQEHPKLIVPGLGTFYKEEIPAQFDAAKNTFLPPSEKILFQSEYSNDSALQQFIASKEKAKAKSIQQFIEQYVNNLTDLLANTEEIKIDGLGTFTKKRNKLHFSADKTLERSNAFFGLKPLKDLAEPSTEEVKTQVTVETVPAAVEEQEELIAAAIEVEEQEESSGGTFKKVLLFILIILLTTLAIVQSFFPSYLSVFWNKPSTEISPVDTLSTAKDSIAAPDTTAVVDTMSIAADSITTSTAVAKPSEPSFEIIVAAFHKQSEADEFIQELATRNLQAHAIQTKKGGLLKISIGTYANEQDAIAALAKTHKELAKNAWIYRVKPLKTQQNVSTTN